MSDDVIHNLDANFDKVNRDIDTLLPNHIDMSISKIKDDVFWVTATGGGVTVSSGHTKLKYAISLTIDYLKSKYTEKIKKESIT